LASAAGEIYWNNFSTYFRKYAKFGVKRQNFENFFSNFEADFRDWRDYYKSVTKILEIIPSQIYVPCEYA